MSDESTTDTYTVSFKSSPGYDASLVVVRGDTVQELADNITALHEDLLSLVVDTENLFHVAYAAKSPTPSSGGGSNTTESKQSSAPAEDSNVVIMTCSHGKRTRRTGTGKKGPWAGHFCPQPKGAADQCAPIWED